MAQNYHLAPSPGQGMFHITVPDEDAPNTLVGKSAWGNGDALQGIMGIDSSQPVDTSFFNNLGPALASSPYETVSHSHAVHSPSWPFVSNSFNRTSFEQDPTANPNSNHQEAWNAVRVAGIPEDRIPRRQHKRQKIRTPEASMSDNFKKLSSELGSQVNIHPTSDSGYATRSATSISVVSPFQIGNVTHPRMMNPSLNTPQAHSPLQNQYNFGGEEQQPGWRDPAEVLPQVNDPQFACDVAGCEWTGKCQSDRKKHMQRHQKRFHCNEAGCSRREGFGTINDLERHQRCVHNIEPKHGNKREFKCFAKNCTKTEKVWPRFDNFKQHLKRMHKDEDTEGLIQRSNNWYESTQQSYLNSPVVHSLPACSSQQEVIEPNSYRPTALQETTQFDNHQPHPCNTISMYNRIPRNAPQYPPGIQLEDPSLASRPFNYADNSVSVGATAATQGFPNTLDEQYGPESIGGAVWGDLSFHDTGVPLEPNDGGRPSSPFVHEIDQGHNLPSGFDSITKAVLGLFKALGREVPNSRSEQPQKENGAGLFETASATDAAAATSQVASVSGMPSYVDLLSNGSKQSKDSALRELLKASLKHLEASQANADVPPPENPPQASKDGFPRCRRKKTFLCRYQGCTRETRRLSEMKKHEKRHSRPYGCTYPRCFKSFGSKNDWKRHENTQHFQLQCWRCPVKVSPINEVTNNDETLMEGPDRGDFPPAFHLDGTRIDCARVFDRKDKFYHHLQRDHFYGESEARRAAKDNEIGRNGQFKFWCGFCHKLIKLHKEGTEAWDERFDHIDNEHFKKKQNIASWIHPEGHLTKKYEEKNDVSGGTSETSENREDVGEEDTNYSNSDGGKGQPAKDTGPGALAVPIHNPTLSLQLPATSSNCDRPRHPRVPAPINRAATRAALSGNLAHTVKRKYASSIASSAPVNNTVAHHTSSCSTAPMMPAPQPQTLSQQEASPGGRGRGFPTVFNPFMADDVYVDSNGLIPIENNFPECVIITCCKCPPGTSEYISQVAVRCVACDHAPCSNCKFNQCRMQ